MADLSDLQAAQTIKIAGANSSGIENTYIQATNNGELTTCDVLFNGGIDTVINLTTAAVELKVGGSPLANRKYVILEGQSTNIKWGFSNTTQSFDVFKSQILMIPLGPNTAIWAKVTAGTGTLAFGEVA